MGQAEERNWMDLVGFHPQDLSMTAGGDVFLCRPSFLFQKSNLDGIINMAYSCHVAFAMICTERERL